MKNIIKAIIFTILVILLMLLIGYLVIPDWKDGDKDLNQGQSFTVRGLYELDDNSIDVLFLGDSSIYKSVSPMQIWEETGIPSYNYSVSSARIYMDYYFLKEILKFQNPKLVIIDNLTIFYKNKETEPEKRKSFDHMKMSKNKLEMINDPVFENTFEDKVSYVFPILRYHTRWNRVNFSKLATDYYSVNKGFFISSKIKPNYDEFDYMEPKEEEVIIKDYSLEYFEKVVNLCKENNIELIFLGIPDKRVWSYSKNQKFIELANEYDVKYIDLHNNEYNLNWYEDTEDGGGHMNLNGAKKISHYISDYLKNNYSFEDKRNNSKYRRWNDDLVSYNKDVNFKLLELKENIDNAYSN